MSSQRKNKTAAFVMRTTRLLAHDEFPRIFLDNASSLKLIRLNDNALWRMDRGVHVANARKYTLRYILLENGKLSVRLDNISARDAQISPNAIGLNIYLVPLQDYAGTYAALAQAFQTAKLYAIVRVAAPDGLAKLLRI